MIGVGFYVISRTVSRAVADRTNELTIGRCPERTYGIG